MILAFFCALLLISAILQVGAAVRVLIGSGNRQRARRPPPVDLTPAMPVARARRWIR